MTKVRPMNIDKPLRFELPTRTFVGLLIPEKLVGVGIRLDRHQSKGDKLKLTPETRLLLAKRIMQEEAMDVDEGTGRLFSPVIFPGKFNEKKWNHDLIAQRLNDFSYVAMVEDWETSEHERDKTGICSKTFILLTEYESDIDPNMQRVLDRYKDS